MSAPGFQMSALGAALRAELEEVTSIMDALSSSVKLVPVRISPCTDGNHPSLVGGRLLS
jgi:hypothetical protein